MRWATSNHGVEDKRGSLVFACNGSASQALSVTLSMGYWGRFTHTSKSIPDIGKPRWSVMTWA